MVIKENQWVIEYCFHLLWVSNEVWREITIAKLHTFNDIKRGIGGSRFLNGDDTILANLIHGVSDHLTNFRITIGGNGTNLRYSFGGCYLN